MAKYPLELRCDFQQYYGLNLDELGRSYSIAHGAALAVGLPPGARVNIAQDKGFMWALEHYLLADIANHLRALICGLARMGKPPQIDTPVSKNNTEKKYITTQVTKILSAPRKIKEADDGK